MPPVAPPAPCPPGRSPTPLPGFVEPMFLIVAAFLGIGAVYRATASVPVTLIAAALAAVVVVAAPTQHRVHLYPTRHRNYQAD